MFKLSKESQITFFCLLIIPFMWAGLNYLGFLDYLKIKSLDWRMQMRGEIAQSFGETNDTILVDGNISIPKVPKVTYVNFDAATLSMDDVGERPWDRAFFRDMAMALIERGNARVLAFDFGFTPKSMSKMVPPENSYGSDMAMGQLVSKYPQKVVLGCLYSGVPTPFVKGVESSAFPPLFKDGYSLESSLKTGKFNYPESPTYPLVNYSDGHHFGRLGSFTVPPYRAVDEIPRWVPLWFPAGGKSHAYNLLGGKRSKLSFELPKENASEIKELSLQIENLESEKSSTQVELAKVATGFSLSTQEKIKLEQRLTAIESDKQKIDEIINILSNFSNTLKANPALSAVIAPQVKIKESELSKVLGSYLNPSDTNTNELSDESEKLKITLKNLKVTLKQNPAIEAIIRPQINEKENRLQEIGELLAKEDDNSTFIGAASVEQAKIQINTIIKDLSAEKSDLEKKSQDSGVELASLREKLDTLNSSFISASLRLDQLSGNFPTELVEHNETLKLVYSMDDQANEIRLVDSLPNQVPLAYKNKVFTLGFEALLAYYGLGEESVHLSKDMKNLLILDKNDNQLINCSMVEGQFLEVNWFSKWTELLKEEELLREARRRFGDGDFQAYLSLVRPIFTSLLERAYEERGRNDLSDILGSIKNLGVDEETLKIADQLLNADAGDEEVPSFAQLNEVASSISYYFVSPRLASKLNPMCGMKDVLENARFQDEVTSSIAQLVEKITRLEGPDFMGKILEALSSDPDNADILAKRKQIEEAISINNENLILQREELARIGEFFASFNNAIVLIGPEEKTFQDLAPTPFDKASVPKVSVHGNLIKTLTTGTYLKRLPDWIDYVATFVVCILMAILAVYQGNRASLVQAGGILLLVGYVIMGFLTFSETHVIWPITTPACAGISTSFIGLAAMVVIEQKAKGKLKGMFGSYVSSDLVEQMVDSGEEPKLGGEETGITAFFSDVQAFSSFSELLTPTGLVDLMNEYLTAMTNILQEERGTLDKYIGDAIVAMYGAPIPMDDHAYQSVRTAILMQQKQIELRKKWVPEVEKWGKCHGLVTQMQTRIGCNTGTATVGNMGALDRFNYTMMGDMVNLAARCESGAKAYGAYIMVTEETKIASEQTKDDIAFRYLDRIVVKGRSQPVAMFEPTGFMNELNQETQDCLDCFSQGIDKYLAQDWAGALSSFEKAKELEPNKPGVTPGVKDNPSMILIDRCLIMQENPPGDDWDGVYVMTTK